MNKTANTIYQTSESLSHSVEEPVLEVGGKKGELAHAQMLKYQKQLENKFRAPPRSLKQKKVSPYSPALPPTIGEKIAQLTPKKEEKIAPQEGLADGLEQVTSSVSSSLEELGKTLLWIGSLPSALSRYFLDLDNKEKDPEIEHTATGVLLPFQASEEKKAAIDDRILNRSFELILLEVLKKRVSNASEEFLKGIEKELFLDQHMKWVKHTQKEIRNTVENQQTWGQWGSMVGMFVGTLGPKLVITQAFSDPFRKLGLPFPDFADPLTKGEWMKKAQHVGETLPGLFQTQSQVYKSLGEGTQLGGQARMERALKRADSAASQVGEVKQNKGKDIDLTKGIIDNLNLAHKIYQ